jgi:acetolactate synthase-1/2/3 large subunit
MATCSQIIADTLKDLGIRKMFGLPGGEILDLIEACRKVGIEFVLTRHEATAAFMADVTGQATGIPGVCLSTVGPGATNLINGVTNAYLDRSPVFVFTAQLSTVIQPYANHQFIALEKLFEPVTKKVFTLNGRETRRIIRKGFRIATTGPKGPVYFCIPSDVGRMEEMDLQGDESCPEIDLTGLPDPGLLSKAIEEIHKAKRPLVLLGIGIEPKEDTEIIRQFIKRKNLPVMATPKAKGIFPDSESLYLGTFSGMMADDLIVDMIMQADLVLGIGFDPVESDKIWHKDIKLLSINGYSIAYQHFLPSMEVVGKIRPTLELLIQEDFSNYGWREHAFKDFKERLRKKMTPTAPPSRRAFSPYAIVQKMREVLSQQAIVTTDVGAHKYIMGQAWESYHPLTFFMSNGLSSMGYGFPAAMAAKLSFPQTPVVCVTGDGGFTMMLQDLETAVRLSLPIVTLIFCDDTLGLIEMVQRKRGYPRYGVDFKRVKFASVAKAFGAKGVKLRSLDELPEIFSQGFQSDKPTVVEVSIDGSEYMGQL